MIVTHIWAYPTRAAVSRPFRSARGWVRERADLLVELVTDSGHSGWGDGGDLGSGPATLATAAPKLLGCDLAGTDPCQLWDDLATTLPLAELSAVDTALWDLRGQALGQPITRLLAAESGYERPRVRAYATGLFYREGWSVSDHERELAREAESYAVAGFAAMKLKTGFGLDADERHVAAIRRVIGADTGLFVDSNGGYSPAQSVALAQRIASQDIGWMEEPADPQDWAGYRRVREALHALSSSFAVAGGERLASAADFESGCEAGAWDVVQPDIIYVGGITGLWRLGNLIRGRGMALVPHCFYSGIALAGTLQLLAALPPNPPGGSPSLVQEPLLEYDQTEHPTREALVHPRIGQRDGFVAVPDGPGLGIEVDRDVLERYATSAVDVAHM